jgi:NTP pyrophosphatase (non-canonical NTP hydrolase)
MNEIINKVIHFREERDWAKFHTPENLSKSIAIEAAELLENFQWSSNFNIQNVEEELADVLIYCILMANTLGLNISEIIEKKLDKNSLKYPIEKSKGNSKKYSEFE